MPSNNSGFWPQWEENRLFTVLLTVLILVGIVFLGALACKTFHEAKRAGFAELPPPTIMVSASEKSSIANNIATVDLGVTNSSPTSSQTQDDNTEKVNAIMAAMRALGIPNEDLKTSSYNMYPQYDYNQAPPKVVGYEASQMITVKIRNSELVSKVLGAAGDLGATNISSLRFETDDDSEAEAEARKEAIASARAQAEEIAKAMGASLGDIVSYSESRGGSGYPYPMYERAMSADAAVGGSPDVSLGQSEVEMTVSVSYSIR